MPAFGTCAGLIVLAAGAVDGPPDQRPLGAIDVIARRNGYGRQVRSFEAAVALLLRGDDEPMHGVFIRAPRIDERRRGRRGDRDARGGAGRGGIGLYHGGDVPSGADRRRPPAPRFLRAWSRRRRSRSDEQGFMSGHSKWSSIKHKKAATDKKRGSCSRSSRARSWSRSRRAARTRTTTSRCRTRSQKARDFSMPKDNIERAIERASGAGRRGRVRDRRLRGLRPGRRGVRGRGADRQPQPHRRERARRRSTRPAARSGRPARSRSCSTASA